MQIPHEHIRLIKLTTGSRSVEHLGLRRRVGEGGRGQTGREISDLEPSLFQLEAGVGITVESTLDICAIVDAPRLFIVSGVFGIVIR